MTRNIRQNSVPISLALCDLFDSKQLFSIKKFLLILSILAPLIYHKIMFVYLIVSDTNTFWWTSVMRPPRKSNLYRNSSQLLQCISHGRNPYLLKFGFAHRDCSYNICTKLHRNHPGTMHATLSQRIRLSGLGVYRIQTYIKPYV